MSAPYREPSPSEEEPAAPAAAAPDVGPRRSSHAGHGPRSWRERGIALGTVAASLLAFLLLPHGLEPAGAVLVLLSFVLVALTFLRGRSRVDVHQDGLVILARARRETVRFEDVDEVWHELAVNDSSALARFAVTTALRLVDRSGRSVRVPLDVTDPAEIVGRVERACTFPLVAEAEAAIDQGETLTFGKARLSATEITVGDKAVAWTDLKLVRVQADQIGLLKSQTVIPWATVSFDAVPHPTLFLRLVRRLAPAIEDDTGMRFGGAS